jgi:hypothetical protein
MIVMGRRGLCGLGGQARTFELVTALLGVWFLRIIQVC